MVERAAGLVADADDGPIPRVRTSTGEVAVEVSILSERSTMSSHRHDAVLRAFVFVRFGELDVGALVKGFAGQDCQWSIAGRRGRPPARRTGLVASRPCFEVDTEEAGGDSRKDEWPAGREYSCRCGWSAICTARTGA